MNASQVTTISPERKAEIAAQIREWIDRHAQHLADNDGVYGYCGCNLYQDVIYGLPEYDPEDPRNQAIPIQVGHFILADGTEIESRGNGVFIHADDDSDQV